MEGDTDTLEPNRQFGDDEGHCAAEVICEDEQEADLHRHLKICFKNPGHKNFIPRKRFDIEHLPPHYRDQDLVNLINILSDLTVLVTVRQRRENRPRYFPDTNRSFPFYKGYKNSDTTRTGTGFVWHVDKQDNEDCECEKCQGSSQERSQKVWGKIYICTSSHVVCDDIESEDTECHFFYDASNVDLAMVPTISGFSISATHLDKDWCMLSHATHDSKLVAQLEKMLCEYMKSIMHLWIMKRNDPLYNDKIFSLEQDLDLEPEETLVLVVSHPHGLSKHISVGTLLERQPKGYEDLTLDNREYSGAWVQYTYNTPTCPGSSGAPVCILAKGWWGWGWNFLHSQGHPGNVNLSGVHWEPVSRNYSNETLTLLMENAQMKSEVCHVFDMLKKEYLDQMIQFQRQPLFPLCRPPKQKFKDVINMPLHFLQQQQQQINKNVNDSLGVVRHLKQLERQHQQQQHQCILFADLPQQHQPQHQYCHQHYQHLNDTYQQQQHQHEGKQQWHQPYQEHRNQLQHDQHKSDAQQKLQLQIEQPLHQRQQYLRQGGWEKDQKYKQLHHQQQLQHQGRKGNHHHLQKHRCDSQKQHLQQQPKKSNRKSSSRQQSDQIQIMYSMVHHIDGHLDGTEWLRLLFTQNWQITVASTYWLYIIKCKSVTLVWFPYSSYYYYQLRVL